MSADEARDQGIAWLAGWQEGQRQLESEKSPLLHAMGDKPIKELRSALLADFRCTRNCELLLCWQASGVRLVRLPTYKHPRAYNQSHSVAAAREKNTSDGERRWNRRVLDVADIVGGSGLAIDLNCDHYNGLVSYDDFLAAIEDAKPGRPVKRVYPS